MTPADSDAGERRARLHAIYLVLNERPMFEASLRSVYPHVDGVTVVTSYDHDRYDVPVTPDDTVPRLLDRDLDADRKVNVLVAAEGTEASLRNRAMAFVCPPGRSQRRTGRDPSVDRIGRPDAFLIVDADEIWPATALDKLRRWLPDHPAAAHRVQRDDHWRSWNWRIEGDTPALALVRPGTWFADLRHVHHDPRQRLLRRLQQRGRVDADLAGRLGGVVDVPVDVARFLHGSWLGDRERVAAKLATSGHRDQVGARWLADVWDAWTPESRDLHPFDPPMFRRAVHVPTAALPEEVTRIEWPEGWIEE